MTTTATKPTPTTALETMARYPLLTAHMICESLGYFSPTGAANAILAHIQGQSNACEWYLHMAAPPPPASYGGKPPPRRTLQEVNRATLARAFSARRHHRGPMAEYARARALVERELAGGVSNLFQSW